MKPEILHNDHMMFLDRALETQRTAWGVFRDRRPDHYGVLLTLDGKTYRGHQHD